MLLRNALVIKLIFQIAFYHIYLFFIFVSSTTYFVYFFKIFNC